MTSEEVPRYAGPSLTGLPIIPAAAAPTTTTTTRPRAPRPDSCLNSYDRPECGAWHWYPSISNQPANIDVVVTPAHPRVGQEVAFIFHWTDADADIPISTSFCDGQGPCSSVAAASTCQQQPTGPWAAPAVRARRGVLHRPGDLRQARHVHLHGVPHDRLQQLPGVCRQSTVRALGSVRQRLPALQDHHRCTGAECFSALDVDEHIVHVHDHDHARRAVAHDQYHARRAVDAIDVLRGLFARFPYCVVVVVLLAAQRVRSSSTRRGMRGAEMARGGLRTWVPDLRSAAARRRGWLRGGLGPSSVDPVPSARPPTVVTMGTVTNGSLTYRPTEPCSDTIRGRRDERVRRHPAGPSRCQLVVSTCAGLAGRIAREPRRCTVSSPSDRNRTPRG